MNFLTDENIAQSVVAVLRKSGFGVKDIKEEKLYGESDVKILQLAVVENRIIITHDKDFCELLASPQRKHSGVILLRLRNQNPDNVSRVLLNVLHSDLTQKLNGNLTIISEEKVTIHISF